MIFLDNASTTNVYPEVADVIYNYMVEEYFNPSATYKPSLKIKKDIDAARKTIADCLGADKNEIVFTSCATESNNWAVNSIFRNLSGNLVISAGEHACIYETAKNLANKGLDLRMAKLTAKGKVDIEDLLSKIDKNTKMVSIIHVSNETGVINDIAGLSAAVKSVNPKIIFHSDGVQAFGKISCNVKKFNVDMYSISGHKFHSPKGIGALFIDKKIKLSPYLNGGGQESGLRSGTENVCGIVAMGKAAEIYKREVETSKSDIDFKYNLFIDLLSKINGCEIIGDTVDNSKMIIAAAFEGCKAEILQSMMADDGILIGRGSACSSRHAGNRVLSAMGIGQRTVDGTIRISLSPATTVSEITTACNKLSEKVNLLRGNNIG